MEDRIRLQAPDAPVADSMDGHRELPLSVVSSFYPPRIAEPASDFPPRLPKKPPLVCGNGQIKDSRLPMVVGSTTAIRLIASRRVALQGCQSIVLVRSP